MTWDLITYYGAVYEILDQPTFSDACGELATMLGMSLDDIEPMIDPEQSIGT